MITMNIKIKNKNVTVIFEHGDKVEVGNYDHIVEEIIKDVNNGAHNFVFDFNYIEDDLFNSSFIGLVSGLSTHLKKKNATVALKGVSDYGKEMITMCGFDKLVKFI